MLPPWAAAVGGTRSIGLGDSNARVHVTYAPLKLSAFTLSTPGTRWVSVTLDVMMQRSALGVRLAHGWALLSLIGLAACGQQTKAPYARLAPGEKYEDAATPADSSADVPALVATGAADAKTSSDCLETLDSAFQGEASALWK